MRLHPLLRISEADLDRADGWFDRRAVPIVCLGRRSRASAASSRCPRAWRRCRSGASSRRRPRGRCGGTRLLLGAGALLGAHYDRDRGIVGPIGTVVLVAVVLACVAGLVWLRRR